MAELSEIRKPQNLSKQQKSGKKSSLDIFGTLNLAKKTDLHKIVEKVHALAKQNNLFLDKVDYKYIELPSIHALRYEILFPLTGEYLDIRKFIYQVTQINSGVVLKNVEFIRENNQVNDIDGVLQFTIYLKSQSYE